MVGGKAVGDVRQFQLLVNVDEHLALDRLVQPGTLDFMWLENHVPIGQERDLAPAADMLKDFHTLRKQPSGKRVIDQVSGNRQQPHIMWVHFAVALQGPKIIGIPAFGPQAFEYSPISATASRADLTCQESAEI